MKVDVPKGLKVGSVLIIKEWHNTNNEVVVTRINKWSFEYLGKYQRYPGNASFLYFDRNFKFKKKSFLQRLMFWKK